MWKTIENYDKICGISMQDLSIDNCQSPMQERVKKRSCCSKEEDKNRVTVVPLTKDRVQTRQRRLKQTGPKKVEKAPARRRRKEVIRD